VLFAKSFGVPCLCISAVAAASIGLLIEHLMSLVVAILEAIETDDAALVHTAIKALHN
jgi:hypothetical protein